ncbi:MAG: exodeoxyribonuclease III [Alphaproteobacteria bacterium]|nr:exodeoxyribonuclease III [Alphaproteobacteria bacterium]
MRVVTWNINSVRLRLPRALELLAAVKPDVLCLQETKALADQFPAADFAEAGYPHQAVAGMKGYNGVAILSRRPIELTEQRDFCGKTDARHVAARVDGGVEVHNFYVPSGGDVPDPAKNEKFAHKLDFLAEMRDWLGANRASTDPMVLVGDLNIAPLDTDVWSHKQLLDVVSHTPVEVEALGVLQGGLGWVDAVRAIIPPEQTLFSWWSYRARDWEASNRGRRLDHVWVTEPLVAKVADASILKAARGWEKASDHVPVIVDLNL